ncbi:MAG: hypothetical protein ACRDVN_14395 [Jiangellaceae bacterium]
MRGRFVLELGTDTVLAAHREILDEDGAIVVGRKLFDFTDGWVEGTRVTTCDTATADDVAAIVHGMRIAVAGNSSGGGGCPPRAWRRPESWPVSAPRATPLRQSVT